MEQRGTSVLLCERTDALRSSAAEVLRQFFAEPFG